MSNRYTENDAQQYADIIDQPRPEPRNHRRMALRDRAAQFAPFAALTGYEAAVRETARHVQAKIEQAEDAQAQLDAKLRRLLEQKLTAEFTYFVPDEHKKGGAYHVIAGQVAKIDRPRGRLLLSCGTTLNLADIAAIEIVSETEYEAKF